jgi:hypothetical protein
MIGIIALWFAAALAVAALFARHVQARALQARPALAKARRGRGPSRPTPLD